MLRTEMLSLPCSSVTTTGRFTTAPTPRIATCGWLMIGVSNSAPLLPRLVIEKVAPDSSSGEILLVRVRSATSAILRAMPAIERSPASLIVGTISPRSVSTAMPRCSPAG
jgi:hypothetical protein